MGPDLDDCQIVTASAYAGMMDPLTRLRGTVAVLSGDTDTACPTGLSIEALDGVRRRWRLADVERLAELVPGVLPRHPRPLIVVPPRVTANWAKAAAGWPPHVRLLGVVSRLADDKVFVREQLRHLGVPVPETMVGRPAYAETAARLGSPFVLQVPRGAGGRGTYLVTSAADLARALAERPSQERWLASRHMGEVTVNIAGLAHAEGFDLAPTSVQASGIADLGSGFGAYCGSDFGAIVHLSPTALALARGFAERVGEWLHDLGHRGIFGCDIAVAGDSVAFLEVNPRIQGSSWLLSRLQRRAGEPECLVEHVRANLGIPVRRPAGVALGGGAHLLARWTRAPVIVGSTPAAGTHLLDDGGEVTLTGLPAPGTRLEPGGIMARLESAHSLVSPSGHELRPPVARLLTALRAGIDPAR